MDRVHTMVVYDVRSGQRARFGEDAVASGQLEVLEADALRADSGGAAEGLEAPPPTRLHAARGQGWAGLAVVGDGAVLGAVSDAEATGLVHERAITRVVVEDGMSALCSFSTGASGRSRPGSAWSTSAGCGSAPPRASGLSLWRSPTPWGTALMCSCW